MTCIEVVGCDARLNDVSWYSRALKGNPSYALMTCADFECWIATHAFDIESGLRLWSEAEFKANMARAAGCPVRVIMPARKRALPLFDPELLQFALFRYKAYLRDLELNKVICEPYEEHPRIEDQDVPRLGGGVSVDQEVEVQVITAKAKTDHKAYVEAVLQRGIPNSTVRWVPV